MTTTSTKVQELIPQELQDKYWHERTQILRKRSEVLIISLVGRELASTWWDSKNKAFDMQTPNQEFQQNPEKVYGYCLGHAQGGW